MERERRIVLGARDAVILAQGQSDTDGLEGLAEFAAAEPMDDLD